MSESKFTPEALRGRAVYYETWAKDIRAMNGHSVDADHSDATARVLRDAADLIEYGRSIISILQAVRMSAGLGRTQLDRIERFSRLLKASPEKNDV